jgi:uncharacterized caspase-like protein
LELAGFDVDVAEDLTKDAMRRTLDRFYDKVKPGAVTLIFFSGYGIQSNRQNYLIPTDAHIWTESDVRRDGMSLAAILSELGNRQPSAAIAVLEAARRNPFERRYRLAPAGLAAIAATPGTLIAHAAAPNALLDDTNRGLFVGELIKQISKADSPVQDVFNRTSLAVSQASQGGQSPGSRPRSATKYHSARNQPRRRRRRNPKWRLSSRPNLRNDKQPNPPSRRRQNNRFRAKTRQEIVRRIPRLPTRLRRPRRPTQVIPPTNRVQSSRASILTRDEFP